MSRYTMAEIIEATLTAHRKYVRNEDAGGVICDECGWEVASKHQEAPTTVLIGQHEASAVAAALVEEHYGDQKAVAAAALTAAADWLANGEAAGIIAFDGPSNRGEVMAAYDAALEDPEGWLRERAKEVSR